MRCLRLPPASEETAPMPCVIIAAKLQLFFFKKNQKSTATFFMIAVLIV
jgi:hypothetical protein